MYCSFAFYCYANYAAGNRHRWDGERRVNGSFIFRSRSSLCLCRDVYKRQALNTLQFDSSKLMDTIEINIKTGKASIDTDGSEISDLEPYDSETKDVYKRQRQHRRSIPRRTAVC